MSTTTIPNRSTTTIPNGTTSSPTPSLSPNPNTNDEKPLIISYYLLKNCRLWVWDFDDTLIDTKYYYKSNMEPEAIRKRTDTELTREVPQWRYFKSLVNYIVKHGIYVGIASFGTYEIIQAYMNRILGFNQTFFNSRNIIAPMYQERVCRRFQPPPNKNEYIYKMMKMYKVEDFKSVVLFDDLPSNIADAIGVGIVGIQMATPNNGDKLKNTDGGDKYASGGVSNSGRGGRGGAGSGRGGDSSSDGIFFGPWVMVDFDKKIESECGKELYLNRTYTGITNRYYQERKKMGSKDSFTNNDTPYKGLSYDKTDFRNGIHESFSVPAAFGTGIGNRKITMSPEVRWNNMNVKNPPQWVNGNWEEATLGGTSISYWDKNQRVRKSNGEGLDNDNDNGNDNDDKYKIETIKPIGINSYNRKINEGDNYVMGVTEGFSNSDTAFEKNSAKTAFEKSRANTAFEKSRAKTAFEKSRAKTQDDDSDSDDDNDDSDDDNDDIKSKFGLIKKDDKKNDDNCETCKKFEWNWIILVLIVIILLMSIIIYNVS